MHLSIHNRALLRGMLAGAVVLAGTSACSRSDRADTGRDTTQAGEAGTAVTPLDTSSVAATQPTTSDTVSSPSSGSPTRSAPAPAPQASSPAGYRAMGEDTAASSDIGSAELAGAAEDTSSNAAAAVVDSSAVATGETTGDTAQTPTDAVAVGDSANAGRSGERLDATEAQANADSLANESESDRVRLPEDSSETAAVVTSDSAAVAVSPDSGAADDEMARDTSTALAQVETAAPAETDTVSHIEADTKTPADTVVAVGDSTEAGKTGERLEPNEASAEANADTLAIETERVRPPEDSTEVLGNLTTDEAKAEADTDVSADASAAGAAGVQSTGNIATGADAVAMMSREGQRCAVVNPEESRDVQWDLAESPATMNPCGTGTMTLPRVQTEK